MNNSFYFSKISRLIILLMMPVVFSNCEEKLMGYPEPSIQTRFSFIIGNDGMAPAPVTFINRSLNGQGFEWDFGDGTTLISDQDTVYHTYEEAGNYTVILTSSDDGKNLHYSNLTHSRIVQIRDAMYKRLYFTCRFGNKVKYVTLDDSPVPIVQEFDHAGFSRPYGLAIDTVNAKVYATDYGTNTIYRYNTDGSGLEVILDGTEWLLKPIGISVFDHKVYIGNEWSIVRTDLDGANPEIFLQLGPDMDPSMVIDMAFDHINNRVYFNNDKFAYPGGVYRMNMDGTGLQLIVEGTNGGAIGIDPENNRLYYYDWDKGMCINNLDGTEEVVFDPSVAGRMAWGMAIDTDGGKIYYPDRVGNTIKRANLDGSNIEVFIPAGAIIDPHGMAIDTFR